MHGTYAWLPDGPLGDQTTKEVMRELFRLARSENPKDTEDLLEIASTRGLRFPRIAMDAAMKERDIARHARDESRNDDRERQEAQRRTEVRHLEMFLALIALLTCIAAVMQAVSSL